MIIYRDLPTLATSQECELSIGNFDGVHRGHQALIHRLVSSAHAQGRLAGVITFDPHPMRVLRPDMPLAYLTTLDERLELLRLLELDFAIVHPFTSDTARTPAGAFMQSLVAHLHLRRLWVGPDFALGHQREGNVPTLRRLGDEMGFAVEVIEPVLVEGIEVRSGHIRQALSAGKVDLAAQMLGRPYWLTGKVIRGAGRGRAMGIPTANLSVPSERVMPAYGVYAAWCHVAGQRRPAAVNIGVRPTFDDKQPTVEAHILDFDGELLGAEVRLELVLRLREERRFPSVEALLSQVRWDVANTRRALAPELPRFEELDHTADWDIRVWGRDFADLLAQAGAAMFALQAVDVTAQPQVWREIQVEAPDREALLVMWLSELLYHSETRGESYTRFVLDTVTETALQARVGGISGLGEKAHIKAVTYHGLSVQETSDGCVARVIFDT
ncbi:MAG: bifunctional riboflavin kinase/FAD synthetase [Anaerolineae bacterium]|nr:bifunctional riboflavin kinase/FAD synthetase [Anaerolineae bacterium]MDW8100320.1 bifunctional riboflavin kinase/FAD synthetase [Anaerolineae bacterium]